MMYEKKQTLRSSGAATRHSHFVCHSFCSLIYSMPVVTSALWLPGGVKPSQSKSCLRIPLISVMPHWMMTEEFIILLPPPNREQGAGSALGWKQSFWMIQWCWRTSEQRRCCCQNSHSPWCSNKNRLDKLLEHLWKQTDIYSGDKTLLLGEIKGPKFIRLYRKPDNILCWIKGHLHLFWHWMLFWLMCTTTKILFFRLVPVPDFKVLSGKKCSWNKQTKSWKKKNVLSLDQ